MGKNSRREYFQRIFQRYQSAGLAEKSRILDEFCQVCGYNRKYAIAKLSGPPPEAERKKPAKRRRKFRYNSGVIAILAALWSASGYLCSVRMKAMIPRWLPWIRKQFALNAATERDLLSISPRQIDRRLQGRKKKTRRTIYGTTRPGTLLKHHIPIKTDHWDVAAPGFTEIDLVSHSGDSAAGEFAYSLNQTDILTTWVETRAVLGKSDRGVVRTLEEMRADLPFRLQAIDSDNGSEFINLHLFNYCKQRAIRFTRGRPYKKDDNAHIEQKNWTHVRKVFGWKRYDTLEVVDAMNDLYRKEWRWFMNLFIPSMKLLKKVRVGSRTKRIYDAPTTPFDRLLESGAGDPDKVAHLADLRGKLNPFELSKIIEAKIQAIVKMADNRKDPVVKNKRTGWQDNHGLFRKSFRELAAQVRKNA